MLHIEDHGLVDTEAVLLHLQRSATVVDELVAPPAPGVYALILDDPGALPTISRSRGPLYIGLSRNLAQREFEAHFGVTSGFSTVRRSLGALLKIELELQARPRGPGASKSNFTNYAFQAEGEQRLSRWMIENLRVGVHAVADPADVERALISLAQPLLNLTGWANPDAAEIKALRKECADEARRRGGAP